MIPQVGGFQGCYLDNHRNNWRCARAVPALCENAPMGSGPLCLPQSVQYLFATRHLHARVPVAGLWGWGSKGTCSARAACHVHASEGMLPGWPGSVKEEYGNALSWLGCHGRAAGVIHPDKPARLAFVHSPPTGWVDLLHVASPTGPPQHEDP